MSADTIFLIFVSMLGGGAIVALMSSVGCEGDMPGCLFCKFERWVERKWNA